MSDALDQMTERWKQRKYSEGPFLLDGVTWCTCHHCHREWLPGESIPLLLAPCCHCDLHGEIYINADGSIDYDTVYRLVRERNGE